MLECAYPRVLRSTVVAEATSKDPTLAKLRDALWSGAELRDPEFRSYAERKLQMSVQEELLGSRVVIPSALQQEVLRLLHEGHPGMTKMKAVARSHVWWSSLDEDITAAVRQCQPDMRANVLLRQLKQKIVHDGGARTTPPARPGDYIYARNFRSGPTWMPARVTDRATDNIAEVVLSDVGPLPWVSPVPPTGVAATPMSAGLVAVAAAVPACFTASPVDASAVASTAVAAAVDQAPVAP
ncbi:hypothetical protein MTO96_026936 [Rhipicephalus appendiculatus]